MYIYLLRWSMIPLYYVAYRYIYIYIYIISDQSRNRAFQAQVYFYSSLFQSNKNYLWTSHLSLFLVRLNVLTQNIRNIYFNSLILFSFVLFSCIKIFIMRNFVDNFHVIQRKNLTWVIILGPWKSALKSKQNRSDKMTQMKTFPVPQWYLHWKNKVSKSLSLGYSYCTFNLN